ncbi:helicase-related protein [Thorsellia kenyensis]|uniref:Helicase-related protein n=2 Tax=Thorsellia kenyensis TaxID=1549888 RepID=A0ABV6CB59_9GAMM
MGKTRIAAIVAKTIIEVGGRVAIVVPPGLGYQWKNELSQVDIPSPPDLIRSFEQYLTEFKTDDKNIYEQQIVLISQFFMTWKLGENSHLWRWSMLPQIYGKWRKHKNGVYPNNYKTNHLNEWDVDVEEVSEVIVSYLAKFDIENVKTPTLQRLEEIYASIESNWKETLDANNYKKDGKYRLLLEKTVGLGFGEFDLIIIDEAHKSRGIESGLNKILDELLIESKSCRRIAITATPVELHADQWKQMFSRIRVSGREKEKVFQIIKKYSEEVQTIKKNSYLPEFKNSFVELARKFEAELSPYLLRRDKSQDESVQKFNVLVNNQIEYREEKKIVIDLISDSESDASTDRWRRTICAIEALSIVSKVMRNSNQDNESKLKRLRLTLANGHGIESCLGDIISEVNETINNEKEPNILDQEKIENDENKAVNGLTEEKDPIESKKNRRIDYWKSIAAQPFFKSNRKDILNKEILFDHPAILTTVEKIEELVEDKNEKVLLFGRFNLPLERLEKLLNTRQMLKAILKGKEWPQSKIDSSDYAEVFECAKKQFLNYGDKADRLKKLNLSLKELSELKELTFEQLNMLLKKQYDKNSYQRSSFRNLLSDLVLKGQVRAKISLMKPEIIHLFDAFKNDIARYQNSQGTSLENEEETNPLVPISRALIEIGQIDINQSLSSESVKLSKAKKIAKSFIKLVDILRENNEGDINQDGHLDEEEANQLWKVLFVRIKDEYDGQKGKFARLLNGDSRPETRRTLQAAFNREESFPKVLIAQSVVGREGLNLHEACRYVILMHPEWNPGVVEQQIGRVDRLGSLWQKKLNEYLSLNPCPVDINKVPRIEIYSVIFKGTYDEINWEVLTQRWSDLKAQLHGVIIPKQLNLSDDNNKYINEINAAAPNFSPKPIAKKSN